MPKKRKEFPLLGAMVVAGLVIISVLHAVSLSLYLYWFYWWLDTVMHLLGGAWVALATVWFFRYFDFYKKLSFDRRIIFISLCVLAVAILWELFEFFVGHVDPSIGRDYWIDTSIDVIAGVLGGLLIAIFSFEIADIDRGL